MNYDEKHSHKWSRVFSDAWRRLAAAEAKASAGETEAAREGLRRIRDGDFSDQEAIFPGVAMWVPYFRAVQGEMALRYRTLLANFPGGRPDARAADDLSARMFPLFVDDVRELLARDGRLDPAVAGKLAAEGPGGVGMGEDWIDRYRELKERTDRAIEGIAFPRDLLGDWMVLSLRGLLAYNRDLNRQAALAAQVLAAHGERGLRELVAGTREEFGWKVSQVFFRDTFGKLDLPQDQLYSLGRYAMFADQALRSFDAGVEGEGVVKARVSRVENCQLYSNFELAARLTGHPVEKLGIAICEYCESHGQKNAALFTPPDLVPDYARQASIAFGAEACLFRSVYRAGDGMERFMEANDIIFAEEAS